ncbi:MAG TPA: outer membrane lipoprotein-sorting protein [Planctomycetes bacterium]|nr:outer membrane lipoprotein-sorting protein [Planctomycetota bacterium]HIJ70775.1 outer membrane lipoprotein-sorting protein [Planctomycetota bacterium]
MFENSLIAVVIFALVIGAAVFAQEGAGSDQPAKQPEVKSETPSPAPELPSVDEIVNKANLMAYYQGADGKAKVKMTITDKKGQARLREFVILRKDIKDGGDQNYYVYFQKPADVRKMVFMVHKHTDPATDDDRWLYLPGLDLVKRIAAGDKRTSFVGSDFLYEDVSGRSLAEDAHELTKTTDELFVIKNVPKAPESVEFSYYDVSIDRATFIPMKMEYYDRKGRLYQIIETEKIETIQDFPTVVKSVVLDLNTGSKTEMEFSDVQYDINLGDIFTERYLRRPPKEARR